MLHVEPLFGDVFIIAFITHQIKKIRFGDRKIPHNHSRLPVNRTGIYMDEGGVCELLLNTLLAASGDLSEQAQIFVQMQIYN